MDQSRRGFNLIQVFSIFLIIVSLVIFTFISFQIGIFDSLKSKIFNNKKKASADYLQQKYCAYAKEILNWVDKTRTEDGKYAFYVTCDQEKKACDDLIKTNDSSHNDLLIIWARYKYFLKQQDETELSSIKKDIDLYFSQLDKMPVQNVFWNCRILSEIRDENILGADYVAKIDKFCKTGAYLTTDDIVIKFNKQTNSIETKLSLIIPNFDLENITKENFVDYKADTKIADNFSSYTSYPSDFVAKYKLWNQEEDLSFANYYFNKLLIEFYLDQDKFLAKDRCLMAISSLDLYSLNKDAKYFNWAKGIYSHYFIEDDIKDEAKNIECAFLNRELAKYDNSLNYKSYENKLLDYFIENYWDGDGGKNELTGQGVFFTLNKKTFSEKNVSKNALMINLLCP